MRDYFLKHLGIGETWMLRDEIPSTRAHVLHDASDTVGESRFSDAELKQVPPRPSRDSEVLESNPATETMKYVSVLFLTKSSSAMSKVQQDKLLAQVVMALELDHVCQVQTWDLSEVDRKLDSSSPAWLRQGEQAVDGLLVMGAESACDAFQLDCQPAQIPLHQWQNDWQKPPVIVTHDIEGMMRLAEAKREVWWDVCRMRERLMPA